MLIQFAVENFLSFDSREVIDLRGTAVDAAHSPLLANVPGIGAVARVAALYGANASGKSNLLRAIAFGAGLAIRGKATAELIAVPTFLLASGTQTAPAVFEYLYTSGNDVYTYVIAVSAHRVERESLSKHVDGSDVDIFRRVANGGSTVSVVFGPVLVVSEERRAFFGFVAEGTRPNQPFLAEAAARNATELRGATGPLVQYDAFAVVDARRKQNPLLYEDVLAREFAANEAKRRFVLDAICNADTGIRGMSSVQTIVPQHQAAIARQFEAAAVAPSASAAAAADRAHTLAALSAAQQPAYQLQFQHNATGENGLPAFTIADQSDGRLRLLELADDIFDAPSAGDVLLYDELERSLHPHLARYVLQIFRESGKLGHSQLIFATHAADLLDGDLVPGDGVWFVEKDAQGPPVPDRENLI